MIIRELYKRMGEADFVKGNKVALRMPGSPFLHTENQPFRAKRAGL
jgi:hypothetical protein